MKINVYLDDVRIAPKGFITVRNYCECIEILNKNKLNIGILSLDHDLGEEKTGYDITKYMVEHNIWADEIYLHTKNPVGRDNMFQLLMRYKPEHVRVYRYSMP
jgi:hypothetical protein